MFGTILRAGVALVGGAMVYVPFKMAGEAVESAVRDFGVSGSQTAEYIGMTVTWFPMLVLAVVAFALITGAAARRGY